MNAMGVLVAAWLDGSAVAAGKLVGEGPVSLADDARLNLERWSYERFRVSGRAGEMVQVPRALVERLINSL